MRKTPPFNYKIKIACTKKKELQYNKKPISRKNHNKINFIKLIDDSNYINTGLILYKTLKKLEFRPITTKTLEFLCSSENELTEIEFVGFIKDMKNIGFSSDMYNTIHLIKLHKSEQEQDKYIHSIKRKDVEEHIYRYRFSSEENIETKNKRKKLKNRSLYSTQILYTKFHI